MRFDEFIMERMGYPWGENEPDKQTRRQAGSEGGQKMAREGIREGFSGGVRVRRASQVT